MAKLKGLKAMFGKQFILERLNQIEERLNDKTLSTLQYFGEDFVNKARSNNTYSDDTGNLRSSIGYIILHDGKVVGQNFDKVGNSQDGESGKLLGMNLANKKSLEFPKGWVLIGVAGMDYALAVEALGFDVITGSTPNKNEIKKLLGEIKF